MICPKCGSLLIPKDGKMVCPSCGYEQEEAKIVEKVKSEKKIEMVKEKPETLPVVDAECPKCGNKKAYFWMEQTRAADEPPTRFYKCTKCGYVWREYS